MEIRELTEIDAAAWAQLLATTFGRDVTDMQSLWDWFHTGCQWVAWGVWDGARLVAQYSCVLGELTLPARPEPFLIGISTNMTVHPDYRGRGLIREVSRPVYQRLEEMGALAGVGFSNAAGVKVDRHSRGYGYQVVGRLSNRIMSTKRGAGSGSITLTSDWPTSDLSFEPSTPMCPAIRFHATPDSIRHRYAEHPFRHYRYGVWMDGDRLRGIVIDRPARLGPARGASLLAAYSDDLGGLLRCWVSSLNHHGIDFIHFLATPGSSVLRSLESMGTCWQIPLSRSPHYLTVKPLRAEFAPVMTRFEQWDCIGGSIL